MLWNTFASGLYSWEDQYIHKRRIKIKPSDINSLERLIKANSGGPVEDDVDVFGQGGLVLFAEVQVLLCEVAVHCNDLLRKIWLLLLQPVKQLTMQTKCCEENRIPGRSFWSFLRNRKIN